MYKIALFASGSGTNVENIAQYFKENSTIECSLILSNKKDAFVVKRAEKLNIPCVIFNKDEFYNSNKVSDLLVKNNIDLIVLAGFLWLVPQNLIKLFPNKIINIHPALLPKYGGKGMYGDKVHEEVIANNESESGITIHYVNENYDDGNIIFQEKCTIERTDNAHDLAKKIHSLEYEYYPKIIEQVITSKNN